VSRWLALRLYGPVPASTETRRDPVTAFKTRLVFASLAVLREKKALVTLYCSENKSL